MNKFACRKKIPIDIFLIFCHDILAMILFRILRYFLYRYKNPYFKKWSKFDRKYLENKATKVYLSLHIWKEHAKKILICSHTLNGTDS
jgi:hypothetical protein